MKKIISLIGAVLTGSVVMAQAVKTDTIKKLVTRKVLSADVPKISKDSSQNKQTGNYSEKQNATVTKSKNVVSEKLAPRKN